MQVPCGLSGREFRARVHSAHPRVSLERGQQVGGVEHLNTGALARPLHVAFTDKLLQHMVSGRVSGRRNLAEMQQLAATPLWQSIGLALADVAGMPLCQDWEKILKSKGGR